MYFQKIIKKKIFFHIELFFRFYMDCLLPEIVEPLYGKRLLVSDIREPERIIDAQQLHNKNKSAKKLNNK